MSILQLDFILDFFDTIGFYSEQIFPFVILAIELIILLVIYAVSTRGLRNRLKNANLSSETITGIVLIVRILFFIIAVILIVNSFGPDVAALVSLSTLFGTALGLAFSQAVSGIVNGLYILVARPFRVGDYVRIGKKEGIVTDITLNYTQILQPDETRLRIPNTSILESEVTNFRVNISEIIDEVSKEQHETSDYTLRTHLASAIHRLKLFATSDHAYRYTFDIILHYSFDHLRARRHFNRILEAWTNVFVKIPSYQVWASEVQGIHYRFTIVVTEARELIEHVADFMDQLLLFYSEDDDVHTREEIDKKGYHS
ncbi:MAG: mechanosensitive ion channel [Candidatus Lokiarchaeota archaeon]|nr:mechanosensitive ion channel [Candidatus Lokiarchaeota archaeon]